MQCNSKCGEAELPWRDFSLKGAAGLSGVEQADVFVRPHCEDELAGVEIITNEQKNKKKTSNIWRGKTS